jgi:hypothetical protein
MLNQTTIPLYPPLKGDILILRNEDQLEPITSAFKGGPFSFSHKDLT